MSALDPFGNHGQMQRNQLEEFQREAIRRQAAQQNMGLGIFGGGLGLANQQSNYGNAQQAVHQSTTNRKVLLLCD